MVAGVTSYGNGCGESIHAGVYKRISMYMDWIKSIVGKDCVVTTGENSANVGTMSNMFYITIVPFLVLLHSFK